MSDKFTDRRGGDWREEMKTIIDCICVLLAMTGAIVAFFIGHEIWAVLLILSALGIWINVKFKRLEQMLRERSEATMSQTKFTDEYLRERLALLETMDANDCSEADALREIRRSHNALGHLAKAQKKGIHRYEERGKQIHQLRGRIQAKTERAIADEQRIAVLERELESARKDKERLDWVEESANNVSTAINRWHIAYGSFREAIDAAREAK